MVPDLFIGADLAAQGLIRSYCGWHIAPTVTEVVTVDGSGSDVLCLPTLHLLDLLDVSNGGYPVTPQWSAAGFLRGVAWTPNLRGVTATIQHGYPSCPPEVQAVAVRLAQASAVPAGGNIRVGNVSITGGQVDDSGIDAYCRAILDRYRIPREGLMLPAAIAVDTVTRLRATTVADEYHNEALDWTSPDELTTAGWSVQPLSGDEYQLDRNAVTSRWQAFGPYEADVASTDRVRFEGAVYDIDGSVQRVKDPTGLLSHTFFLLVAHDNTLEG